MLPIGEIVTTILNFNIFEYMAFHSNDQSEMIGTASNSTLSSLEGLTNKNPTNILSSKGERKIVNVVSRHFLGDDKLSHFVVEEENKEFYFRIRNGQNEYPGIQEMSSKRMPIVLNDPETLEFIFGWQMSETEIGFHTVSESGWQEIRPMRLAGKFSEAHSSAMIDMTGDLEPNIVLNLEDSGVTVLQVYKLKKNALIPLFSIPVPRKISAVSYAVLKNIPGLSILYLSEENGSLILNVHTKNNIKITEEVVDALKNKNYSKNAAETTTNEYEARSVEITHNEEFSPLFEDEHGLPCGLKYIDFFDEGNDHIMVNYLSNNNKRRVVGYKVTLADDKLRTEEQESAVLAAIDNILNVSVADCEGKGEITVQIMAINNGSIEMRVHKLDSAKDGCFMKICVVGADAKKNGIPIPASFYCKYDESREPFIAFQNVYLSYPALENPGTVVFTDTTNFFIHRLVAKINYHNTELSSCIFEDVLLPNTSILIAFDQKNWRNATYFFDANTSGVGIALVVILLINTGLLIIFAMKEVKDLQKRGKKSEDLRPLISTL
ncbi:hypothetical protein ENBRE01_1513 [Enteropsectra breve]|nr:hypothetical protein ENBRE01_1513 [Enteropsectra breve]